MFGFYNQGVSNVNLKREVARVVSNAETVRGLGDVARIGTRLLLAGDSLAARAMAKAKNDSAEVQAFFEKTAVDAMGTGNSNELSPSQSQAVFQSMGASQVSIPDALNPVRVAMRTSAVVFAAAGSGYTIAEGGVKLATALNVAADATVEQKTVGFVVVAPEFLRVNPQAEGYILQELTGVLGAEMSVAGYGILDTAAVAAGSSAGDNAEDVCADLGALAAALDTGARSRLYVIVDRVRAARWATLGGSSGLAFPSMTINGGTIGGFTVLANAAADPTKIMACDSSRICLGSDPLILTAAEHGDVRLVDTESDVAPPTSLWQSNLRALRAERLWSLHVAGDASVATLDAESSS
jgi:hypothetical protein